MTTFPMVTFALLSLLALLADSTAGLAPATGQDWHGRSIYFVVTDRFAKSTDAEDSDPECLGHDWCGGTLLGVKRKLDYIQSMGFDAVWITPPVKQVEWRDNWNGTGYHGYWAADFFEIDPHFGTSDDLVSLKAGCEARGMFLMVDIVVNHVGPIHSVEQIAQLGPGLNATDASQFHQLNRSAEQSLASYISHPINSVFDPGPCWPYYQFAPGLCNYTVLQEGWFGDLADLKQEEPAVSKYLLDFVTHMRTKYRADGFRLDTATYVPRPFLTELTQAAGTFVIGEVSTWNFTLHASYNTAEQLPGLLNFPVVEFLKPVLGAQDSGDGRGNATFARLRSLLASSSAAGYADPHLLGTFVDNHDEPRFLYNVSGDESRLRNGLAFSLLWHGLPIVYYGTEQPKVSLREDARVSMWPHFPPNLNVTDGGGSAGHGSPGSHGRGDNGQGDGKGSGNGTLPEFLATLNGIRRERGLSSGGAEVLSLATVVEAMDAPTAKGAQSGRDLLSSVDSTLFAFVRAGLLVLLTNAGQGTQGTACFNATALPAPRWSAMCEGPTPSAPAVALGGPGDVLSCTGGVLCVRTYDGKPGAYVL